MAGDEASPQIGSAAGTVSDNQGDGLAPVEIGNRFGCRRPGPESQAARQDDKCESSKHGQALLAEFPEENKLARLKR
jgi:hypothetical protein